MSQLVTGSAVLLDLRPARVPTRMLAAALDLGVVGLIAFGLDALTGAVGGSDARQQGLTIVGSILFSFGYPTAMETLNRGRTVGALALGLRAVRDDGGALSFRQALIRAFGFWMVDFAVWTGLCGGLVCATANPAGKRIGDLLAGTIVIRTRSPRPVTPPPPATGELAVWVATAELSRLPDSLTGAARLFVARAPGLLSFPAQQLAQDLARQVAQRVAPAPPPGTPPPEFLAAVVGERRRRETERVTGHPNWVPSAAELPAGWR